MDVFGITDIGTVRVNNQDMIFIADKGIGDVPNLFIVADGMGGHKAGEVASAKSIEHFTEYISSLNYCEENCLDLMLEATQFANIKVFEMSIDNEDYQGMGTTFSACVIDGGKIYITHVGDSRIYIFGDGKMAQLTTDHTYVNELVKAGQFSPEAVRFHPRKNIVTRALGVDRELQIDALVFNVYHGDSILLCSDGLTNTVSDEELDEIVTCEISMEDKALKLIDLAKLNGATDNISVVLVKI